MVRTLEPLTSETGASTPVLIILMPVVLVTFLFVCQTAIYVGASITLSHSVSQEALVLSQEPSQIEQQQCSSASASIIEKQTQAFTSGLLYWSCDSGTGGTNTMTVSGIAHAKAILPIPIFDNLTVQAKADVPNQDFQS